MKIAAQQHLSIAELVAKGDEEAAGAAMKEHVEYSAGTLRRLLETKQGGK